MKYKSTLNGVPYEIRVAPTMSMIYVPGLDAGELLLSVQERRNFSITVIVYDWVWATVNAVPSDAVVAEALKLKTAVEIYITETLTGSTDGVERDLAQSGFSML